MKIHNYEVERFCLASLLRFPNLFSDIEQFVNHHDFVSKLNSTIFSVVRSLLLQNEDLNDFIISEKIRNMHIRFEETDIEVADYLEALRLLQVNEKSALGFFKQLKKITMRREISEIGVKLQQSMQRADDASPEEILQLSDQIYTGAISAFEVDNDFVDIYESLERKIEERGENPLDQIGFMGPFPKWNELYGSMLRDGAITVIGARTGVGKTTLGMYFLNWVAEQYNVPILHLDHGEMSPEELQFRTCSMFTGGEVTYDMLEKGTWRKHPELVKLVRGVWPRVKKIKHYYYDISLLTPDEIISLIRRFFLRKIGRGNKFLTHYDYLKAFDLSNPSTPEWQVMGHFLQKIKSFYKNDLHNPFWTSLQLNRSGIAGNKTIAQLDDTENTFGVSDRITQQSTHSFLVRRKILDEIALEANQFGNTKAICVKHRHLGENVHDALTPVRLPTGQYQSNFIHLNFHNFTIEERGDLASTAGIFGQLNAQHHHAAPPTSALVDDSLSDDSLPVDSDQFHDDAVL